MTLLEFCRTYPQMRVNFCYDPIYKSIDVTFTDPLCGFRCRKFCGILSEEKMNELLVQVGSDYRKIILSKETSKHRDHINIRYCDLKGSVNKNGRRKNM